MRGGAAEIAAAVRAGERSAVDVAVWALANIDIDDPKFNAFLDVVHDRALEQAVAVDARVRSGEGDALPLAGVPVALKDNICLAWGRTTCGSRFLEGYRSPFTATAAQRLIAAGAVIVGKTNLDEFAMGSSGEHSAFGPTRNPWDVSRVPGGSSSGSTAAVAAGMVPLALGSDTGGSIRQPASHCGVVGVKPTYGRVSRYGLVAYASSLDQIGPLCGSVLDAAVCLDVICGEDPHDATSSPREAGGCAAAVRTAMSGASGAGRALRLGVPRFAWGEGNHPAVRAALEKAIAAAKGAGATVVDVDLPHAGHGIAAYYIVATAEASSNLSRFDGVRYGRRAETAEGLEAMYVRSRTEGFGAEVRRRIMLGTHVLSSGYYDAYYLRALKARRLIKQDYDAVFARDDSGSGAGAGGAVGPACDAVLMPASPNPAFRIGEKQADPMALYLEDVYTVGVNLAGLPAVTLPAATAEVDGSRVPIGVQLIGPAFAERALLAAAAVLEAALGFAERPAGAGVSDRGGSR